MGGGAWPFLVGGVNRLLNCVNERDLGVVNGGGLGATPSQIGLPLTLTSEVDSLEAPGNNRSVMPFDVSGDTRATLMEGESDAGLVRGGVKLVCGASLQPWLKGLGNLAKLHRDGDRSL